MGILNLFHHVGTLFLFIASILLLVTTITAPVVSNLGMLKAYVPDAGTIYFGTFGYCIAPNGQSSGQAFVNVFSSSDNVCTPRVVGYEPVEVMEAVNQQDYGSAARNTADGLTRVQVLHPIVCGLAFISFLFAAGAGVCGSLFAFLLSAITWILTLVVMATDFTSFGIVRDKVNSDPTATRASFGPGMWTELAAMIFLFFGMFIVLFSCFRSRKEKRNSKLGKHEAYAAGPAPTTTRRHFWQRRARY